MITIIKIVITIIEGEYLDDGRHYHPDRTNWWTFSGIF
jgi:hypothetical protein